MSTIMGRQEEQGPKFLGKVGNTSDAGRKQSRSCMRAPVLLDSLL
jgi:hypothetical protein